MRKAFDALLLGGLAVVLAGCAGTGVVAPSDPAAQLRDAENLFGRQDRPLIAERLIRDAMETYREDDDRLGLANAYRIYGFFFRSSAIEGRWKKYYQANGFLDKSARFEARYEKSIEYLEKARAIFADYKRFDALTNVNLNIGFTYEVMGHWDAACRAFERSLENNRDSLGQDSPGRVALPRGFGSYEEFLAPHRERAGCMARHHRSAGRRLARGSGRLPDAGQASGVESRQNPGTSSPGGPREEASPLADRSA
jgi:tetratricopeptide (TPR) repeat protein